MKRKIFIVAVVAAAAGLMMTSCKGSKQVAKTPEQKAAATRGVKLDKEECEEMAMPHLSGLRALATANRSAWPKIRQRSTHAPIW